MPDFLFVGKCYLRDNNAGRVRWVPAILVLRGLRLSLHSEDGHVFEAAARGVTAEFTRAATLVLTVGHVQYVLSNIPPGGLPTLSLGLRKQLHALSDEQVEVFRSLNLGRPPAAYWRNWRQYLTSAGSAVSGGRGATEIIAVRSARVISVVGLASIAILVIWLVVNGGRPL